MAIGIKPKLSQVFPNLTPMSTSGCDIPFFNLLESVVSILMKHSPWMHIIIKYVRRILFYQLRRTGKIRYVRSTDAANKLAVSFVISRLDYCNSFLASIPDHK